MDTFADILADIENWLGIEEKKVVAFLKPIITDVVAAGKQDLLADITSDAPAVAAAFVSGGAPAALAIGVTDVTTQLEAQGKALAATTVTALAAAAVASAQASTAVSATSGSGTGA
jgi:hypothetical protein